MDRCCVEVLVMEDGSLFSLHLCSAWLRKSCPLVVVLWSCAVC